MAFREKHSTELAALELVDTITQDLDNGTVGYTLRFI